MVRATGCVVVVTVCRRLDTTRQPTTMQTMMGMITKSTTDETDPPTAGPRAMPGEGIRNIVKCVVLKLLLRQPSCDGIDVFEMWGTG